MKDQLTAEIRFRCPSCQKLYCSGLDALPTAGEAFSEFDCMSCSESFLLLNKYDSLGIYKTEKKVSIDLRPCPKCGSQKQSHSDECPHCGVLESRYNEIQKLENPRLYELNKKWNHVLLDMLDDHRHQEFLNLAQSLSALNFAAQKYTELKQTMGSDLLIERYLRQIEVRLETFVAAQFNKEKTPAAVVVDEGATALEKISAAINLKNLFMLIGITGLGLLIYNKIHPTFPNLTGLVIALTILSFGLWVLSLNKDNKSL